MNAYNPCLKTWPNKKDFESAGVIHVVKACISLFFSRLHFVKNNRYKAYWLVIKHLSVQGKPNPRGKFYYLWCPNKLETLF